MRAVRQSVTIKFLFLECPVVKLADLAVLGAPPLRITAVLICRVKEETTVDLAFAPMVLAAASFMLVKFLSVHLRHSFNFLDCYRTFAEWTRSINHKPLLDAGRMEIVSNVTR